MYYTLQKANGKCADQTARMRRLVCPFAVLMQQNQTTISEFLAARPIELKKKMNKSMQIEMIEALFH